MPGITKVKFGYWPGSENCSVTLFCNDGIYRAIVFNAKTKSISTSSDTY